MSVPDANLGIHRPMRPFLRFEEVGPEHRAEVGGKAASLALLASRGLPVPAGLVVPASTFRRALVEGGQHPAAISVRNGEARDLAALRAAILELNLPFERALIRAARRLGGRLAVRSSATDEDGRRESFAGQHLTELEVGPDGLADSLRRCWASLYSEGALAYRGRTGPDPGQMAVLIQPMLEPMVSGVMFTINPLNGSWREMTVESTWGLWEPLVAGQITPHWYLVRRPRRAPRPVQRVLSRVRLQVMQRDLPPISHEWRRAKGGGVSAHPVTESKASQPTLATGQLLRVCRLGLRIEALLGQPQDVEWAMDRRGVLHVLQARPITRTGTPRVRTDIIWTRRFVGERWPEPVTPMGWSIVEPLLRHFVHYPKTQLRYLGGGPPLKVVSSRPYVNVTVFRHLAFKLPGAPRRASCSSFSRRRRSRLGSSGSPCSPTSASTPASFGRPLLRGGGSASGGTPSPIISLGGTLRSG